VKDFYCSLVAVVQKTTASGTVNTHNLAFTKVRHRLVVRRLRNRCRDGGDRGSHAGWATSACGLDELSSRTRWAQQFTVDVLYGCRHSSERGGRTGQHVGWGNSEAAPFQARDGAAGV